MPRAVIADQLGPIDHYSLREHDPGPPGPGQVRLRLKAAGVSFVDVLTAEGGYHVNPPVPFIPGSEFAGVVEAIGADVAGLSVGQQVAGSSWGGVFAEAATFSVRSVRPLPSGLSFEEAAVFPSSYGTVWHSLIDRANLQQGETLLVLGAGGASGYAAVQVGKYLGARVIASASSQSKRALALNGGADATVDTRAPTWRQDVLAANNGKPVDVVFDPVGGSATEPAFRALGWKGRHLIVGFPGGIASLPTNLPLLKGASLIGINLRQFSLSEPARANANQEAVFALAAQGRFRPALAKSFQLEHFAQAMAEVKSGRLAGRVVLVMP